MRKALLLYNPLSGGRRARRLADVEAAAAVLRNAGVEVSIAPTEGPRGSAQQARHAASEGVDSVFACGGDGTVHDLLQGLVGTGASLGIIPLGTANTLAHDLRLPLTPVGAARASLQASIRRIAVGQVGYQDFAGNTATRYFTVTVGIGVDAHLFYRLNAAAKHRLGMTSYYWKATWLWLTHPLEYFRAEVSGNGRSGQVSVSQLLAVRIRNFGGVLRELAPGASLDRQDLRLVLFRTRSRISYLRYIIRGLLGTAWQIEGIELADAERVECPAAAPGQRVFVEADGELLGTLPAEISILPDALNLLVP
ncbi:MAG TPA: diacylglycerol kinase family protein [Terriglobales bacterium]|nr:diacylglycerol kinase family protein [Terriglobales bacterium]